MLQVTETAIDYIKEELEEMSTDIKNPHIRLHMGIGWGGAKLEVALVESARENDKVTEVQGLTFIFNENQSSYFENVKVDFVKNFFGSGRFTLVRN